MRRSTLVFCVLFTFFVNTMALAAPSNPPAKSPPNKKVASQTVAAVAPTLPAPATPIPQAVTISGATILQVVPPSNMATKEDIRDLAAKINVIKEDVAGLRRKVDGVDGKLDLLLKTVGPDSGWAKTQKAKGAQTKHLSEQAKKDKTNGFVELERPTKYGVQYFRRINGHEEAWMPANVTVDWNSQTGETDWDWVRVHDSGPGTLVSTWNHGYVEGWFIVGRCVNGATPVATRNEVAEIEKRLRNLR
ncbi:MAG: hypothetical protein PHH13_01080 [Candidatus Peribacteraceae bacterium]|nr:hypothetical protein [Candidatus Peribacteraceae bacterium]